MDQHAHDIYTILDKCRYSNYNSITILINKNIHQSYSSAKSAIK